MSATKGSGRRVAELWQESEERFQLFVDNVPDYAIFMTDLNGTITSWNAGVGRLLGYAEDEFVGQPFSIIFLPEDAEAGAPRVQLATAATTGRSEDERWHFRKDGARFWASGVLTALRDTRGHVRGYAKIMRDITERKLAEGERGQLLQREQQARREAEAANRSRDEFLATLSHELRTPLNAIVGWTTLLRTAPHDASLWSRGLEVIARNAQRQATLIDDLLEWRRTHSGHVERQRQPVDLTTVVKAVVEQISPGARARSIRIDVHLDARDALIAADAAQMEQVLIELVSNAIKFTPAGGLVTVGLKNVDQYAMLTVEDTGAGISSEFLPHVFEPFRQADSTARRAYGGQGLGLAIVQRLIERQGGTIAAASDGLDRGAVFTVQFPILSTGVSGATPAVMQPSVSLGALRVLVIDDDDDSREVTTRAIEWAGATAEGAASVREALTRVDERRPDVIVCDVAMAHQDGFDFIESLRALPPERGGNIPAIAFTAYTGPEDRLRALTAGFQMHLAKPSNLEDLIAGIAAIAGRSHIAGV